MGEERTQNERDILYKVSHPGIVKLFAALTIRGSDRQYALVMGYCHGGDVATKIQIEGDPGLPYEIARRYSAQALDAVSYLHAQHIMHRDLKPSNLLLTAQDNCKIADFGVGKTLGGKNVGHTAVGTPLFSAPEIGTGRYEYSADI